MNGLKKLLVVVLVINFILPVAGLVGCSSPTTPVTPDSQAQDAYKRGNDLLDEGKYEEAVAMFDKVIELEPRYASAYDNRGCAYFFLEQYDLAIADFNTALELDPEDAIAYHNRGSVYRVHGHYDLAIADYTMAIELDPGYTTAYFNRGRAYFSIAKYDLTIADCSKAIELNPKYASAYCYRGDAYRYNEQFDKAIADYNKVIELSNDIDLTNYAVGELAKLTGGNESLIGKIAFTSYRDSGSVMDTEIYIMNPDGSNQQRITSYTGNGYRDRDEDPVWSPNADKIVFTSWRDGDNELFVVNVDGTGDVRLSSRETGGGSHPSWSPDGSRIAFASDGQVCIINADGSNQIRLSYVMDFNNRYYSFSEPSWSPDGSKILGITHWATIHGDEEDSGGIYIFSVNTGDYTQLTHYSADYNAVWSPDGSKITFVRAELAKNYIYVMNSDGSGLTKLTEGDRPVWSPDGSKIAFVSDKSGNGMKLYVVQPDGSGETNLMGTLSSGGVDLTPSWSPDGKKLVFHYLEEIYIVNSDGSGLVQITTHAKGGPPIWSPK